MLKPTIYIVNNSAYDFSPPETDEAVLSMVMGSCEPRRDAITLYITDNPADLKTFGKSEGFVFFVYIGTEKPKLKDDPYILDSIMPPLDPEEMMMRVSRWLRAMIRDYQAWIYRTILQTLIDTSPDVVWVKDRDERHVVLNKEFCRVVEKEYDFCLNKKYPDIWDTPWEEYESEDFICRRNEHAIIETGKTGIFQEPVTVNGEMKQFTTYKTPIYDYFGNVLGTCGIAHDVTNINNIGKELDIYLSAIPYPAFLCDRDYEIQRLNSAADNMINVKGQGIKITNYRTWKEFFLKKEDIDRAGEGPVYMFLQGANRTYFSVIEKEVRDYFGNETGYFCMLRDITYQCMYEDLMFQAANVDALTGTYNRRYFYKDIEQHASKPLTLLYMDLDNFKKVNDVYGHDKGDEILTKTAKIIQEEFPDDNLFRLGGDEFAMLIPGYTKKEDLKNRFTVIAQNVALLADEDLNLGISIGHESTEKLEDANALIKECDAHMYEKKHRNHGLNNKKQKK